MAEVNHIFFQWIQKLYGNYISSTNASKNIEINILKHKYFKILIGGGLDTINDDRIAKDCHSDYQVKPSQKIFHMNVKKFNHRGIF